MKENYENIPYCTKGFFPFSQMLLNSWFAASVFGGRGVWKWSAMLESRELHP